MSEDKNDVDDLASYQAFSAPALEWARYFSSLIGAGHSFPFGPDSMVFKVAGKMFGLLYQKDDILRLNLKCDPEHAQELRHIFSSVIPGYHMNKKHWNTILLNGELPKGEIERQIDHSYQLVVNKLPKKQRLLLTQDRASHK
jgi:predicted DNA-binding protein (MmcQ/YjbR family)